MPRGTSSTSYLDLAHDVEPLEHEAEDDMAAVEVRCGDLRTVLSLWLCGCVCVCACVCEGRPALAGGELRDVGVGAQ